MYTRSTNSPTNPPTNSPTNFPTNSRTKLRSDYPINFRAKLRSNSRTKLLLKLTHTRNIHAMESSFYLLPPQNSFSERTSSLSLCYGFLLLSLPSSTRKTTRRRVVWEENRVGGGHHFKREDTILKGKTTRRSHNCSLPSSLSLFKTASSSFKQTNRQIESSLLKWCPPF